MNNSYQERKKERTEYFNKYIYKVKERPCSACNGLGRYDHNGNPKCGGCNGTGKDKYKDSEVFKT